MDNIMHLTVQIKLKDVEDLLVSAFEGGSNYWYDDLEALDNTSEAGTASEKFYENIMTHGFWILDKETGQKHQVPVEKLETGLKVMYEKFPRHFGNFKSENADAETGDVFLQCVVFGDVIYG